MTTNPAPSLGVYFSIGGGGAGPRNVDPALLAEGWSRITSRIPPWASFVFLRAVSGTAKGYPGSSIGPDYAGNEQVVEVDGRWDQDPAASDALARLRSTFAAAWDGLAMPVMVQDSAVLWSDRSLSSAALYAKYVTPWLPGVRVYDSASALPSDSPTWKLIRYAKRYKGVPSIVESNPEWGPQHWQLDTPGVTAVQADMGTWLARMADWRHWTHPIDCARRGIRAVATPDSGDHDVVREQAKRLIAAGVDCAVWSDMDVGGITPR